MDFVHPKHKLDSLPKRDPMRRGFLFIVAYVDRTDQRGGEAKRSVQDLLPNALSDLQAAHEGGADGIVFINEWCSYAEFESVLSGVREQMPRDLMMGVNALGEPDEPYGVYESFRLARRYGCRVVWTDFSGVDAIEEAPPISMHAIGEERKKSPDVFYCSGVHMKYSTLRDPVKPLELSALQAMGHVDGIVLTGPATGVASDPARVRRVKGVVGDYPVGLASGVTAENVGSFLDQGATFFLVGSSLMNDDKRIIASKVRSLADAMRAGR